MIWACDAAGESKYFSPDWESFTGQKIDQALGRGWLAMLHPDDREQVNLAFQEACRNQTSYTVHHRLWRANGSYAQVVAGAVPSRSQPDGCFIGFLGSVLECSGTVQESQDVLSQKILARAAGTASAITPIDSVVELLVKAYSLAQGACSAGVVAGLELTLTILFEEQGLSASLPH